PESSMSPEPPLGPPGPESPKPESPVSYSPVLPHSLPLLPPLLKPACSLALPLLVSSASCKHSDSPHAVQLTYEIIDDFEEDVSLFLPTQPVPSSPESPGPESPDPESPPSLLVLPSCVPSQPLSPISSPNTRQFLDLPSAQPQSVPSG
ncbi:hypothetical protein M9458_043013, partial [Cirrhinus mrigala]